MRLPGARRTAVRVGSILVAVVAAGAVSAAGVAGTPAAATEVPSWRAAVSASIDAKDLLPRLVGGSPSAAPSPSPSTEKGDPSPEPSGSARPQDPDPEEPDGSGGPDGPDTSRPETVDLSVTLGAAQVDVGPSGRSMRVDLRNGGHRAADDVRLTIDATALAATVAVALPSDGCTADPKSDGRKVTCVYPGGDLAAGAADSSVTFFLLPEPGAKPAPGGAVTVSVTSGTAEANPADNIATSRVRVVESGVDLVAQVDDVTDLMPGQAAALAFVVANQGTETARGMTMEFTLPPYVSFVDEYQTCTYTADRRRMVCDFATVSLAGDQALTAADFDAIRVQVASDAPGPATLGRGTLAVTALGQTTPLVERGTGPALRSIAAHTRPMASVWPHGADVEDHTASFAVSVTRNPADLTVATGPGSGAEGDIVRVQITVTNNGPADAVGGFTATVDAPTGTEIVGAPPECKVVVAGRRYTCVVPHQIEVGAAQIGQLNLRITGKHVGDDGAVVVSRPAGVGGADETPANNRAAITVTVSGGNGGGGWLPVTGSQVNVMVLGGLALLAAGFLMYLAGRRRRAGEPAPAGQVAEKPPSTQIS